MKLVTLKAICSASYISPYQKRNSTKAPEGFILADDPTSQVAPERIREESIRAALKTIFPVIDESRSHLLDLHDFRFGEPGWGDDVLLLVLRLVSFGKDAETGELTVEDIIEQDISGPQIPLPWGPAALSQSFREELLNVEKTIRERMDLFDMDGIAPQDLLLFRPMGDVWDVVEP